MAKGLGFSLSIDRSRLDKKLRNYRSNLTTILRSEWEMILRECMADIAKRAPSPDVELGFLLGGNYPLRSDVIMARRAALFPYAGERVHFNRHPGMWIKEAVMDPAMHTANSQDFSIGLGRVAALDAATRFSWVNFSRKSGAHEHTSEYGTWSFFEYGKRTSTISPRNFGGTSYKLKPSERRDTWAWVMDKTYPPLRMFTGFDRSVFIEAVRSRIRTVQF